MMLGALSLASRAWLAPLEGVSDVGFRGLCASRGAGLTWTEMVRAPALASRNAAALALVDTHDASTPTGVQLLASTPAELLGALRTLEELSATPAHAHLRNIRAIDLNFGCPSPAVLSHGAGPALLHRRARVRALFRALSEWRERNTLGVRAVGAKLRLGLHAREAAHGVYLDAGRAAAEEGLDYVVLHARHAAQTSSSPPDWTAFARMRSALEKGAAAAGVRRCALIANGNIRGRADADALVHAGGADGVMLARAAMRNPWSFAEFAGLSAEAPAPTAPARPPTAWPENDAWPTPREVDDAEAQWRRWASFGAGTRDKHRVFHAANFARLRSGARSATLTAAPTEHLS